ncbi:MAG: nucleotide exchange factor GrpE [Elstera sp.]
MSEAQQTPETAPEEEVGTSQPQPDPFEVIVALQAEVATYKDQALRALADAENTRRRAERDREDASKYAVSGFARDLLSVADNLRRALDAVPPSEDETVKALVAGVEATERELLATFERRGLTRIDALGQIFDPNLHEAVFEVPNTGQPTGTVVQVLQTGYRIHDRLLRPAMVGVAKGEAGAQVNTSA